MDSQRVALGRVLLADGGDFFHRIPIDRWRESIVAWREMERLEYDAVALGELELRQWSLTDSLLRLGTKLPLVTTNIERRAGEGEWKPIGARYRIVDVDGVRVGFISVLPEGRTSSHALEQTKGAVRMLPAIPTTREVARLLKGASAGGSPRILDKSEVKRIAGERVDLLVLLGYLDQRGMQDVADSIPEIDLILGGVHQARDEQPVRLGGAIVNRSGDRGVAVAVTHVVVSPASEIVEFSGRTAVLDESLPHDPQVEATAQAATEASERDRVARREKKRKERLEQLRLEREQQERDREPGPAAPAPSPAGGAAPAAPEPGGAPAGSRVKGRSG